jgi:hypothetical protein
MLRARAFRADNGELGISLNDANAFLDACEADRVEVFGWEFWLADHTWPAFASAPIPSPGGWVGLIPLINDPRPAVFHGDGDLVAVRRQIENLKIDGAIEPRWLSHVRINFTLGD